MIKKIKIKNYKKFKEAEINFSENTNVLVGENGVGKTSILEAIDLVLTGSLSKIEKNGIKSLFNVDVVNNFMNSSREYDSLPILKVELYFSSNIKNYEMEGIHHSDEKGNVRTGLYLEISKNESMSKEIAEFLNKSQVFPFEFYSVKFKTFSGKGYSSYNKYKNFIKHSFIRNDILNNKFQMREYIDTIYEETIAPDKRRKINALFRNDNENFKTTMYSEGHIPEIISIDFDSSDQNYFQKNITLLNNGVDVNHIGHGERLLKKMEMKTQKSEPFDILLIEEPENHLSHLNMHKLIEVLKKSRNSQTFISTHNNMISSRLNLKNITMLSDIGIANMYDINGETARFFMKAPDTNLLNFILSEKSILVEGDAEYILMNKFYKVVNGNENVKDSTAIISCGGKTFKRYLDIAKILEKKVAVVTDNDGDYQVNITDNYSEYIGNNIKIFSDDDDENYTFEVCIYNNNTEILDDKMLTQHMSNGLQQYMLKNKTESAFRLLELLEGEDGSEILQDNFVIPKYIEKAILWIK